MSKSNENNTHVVTVHVGTQAASIELPGVYVRKKSKIRSVRLLNQADLAADNTNFLQVQVLAAPGGAVLAEVDTRAANEGALVKNVAKLAPETELLVAAGSSLAVNVVKNGTGVPTLAKLEIEMYPL